MLCLLYKNIVILLSQLSVHLLCGACLPYLKKKNTEDVLEAATSQNTVDVGIDSWSAIQDPTLISFAKQIFLHITRILHVLMHVIEETNPLAGIKVYSTLFDNSFKLT